MTSSPRVANRDRFDWLLALAVLALPLFVPVVLPAAQSTARLLAGRPVAEAMSWLRILIAFDIVFVVACALAFPFTLED